MPEIFAVKRGAKEHDKYEHGTILVRRTVLLCPFLKLLLFVVGQ